MRDIPVCKGVFGRLFFMPMSMKRVRLGKANTKPKRDVDSMKQWLKNALAFEKNEPFDLGEKAVETGVSPPIHLHGRSEKTHTPPFFPSVSLARCERSLTRIFGHGENDDFIVRRFRTGHTDAFVAYIDGMVDSERINEMVLRPMMHFACKNIRQAEAHIVSVQDVSYCTDGQKAIDAINTGMAVLMMDGDAAFLTMETRSFPKRSVSTPENERVLRGPQQGFIEDLRTNIGLVRNLARTADVCTQFVPMGGNNGLRCALMFRHGVTDRHLLAEVRQRMARAKELPGFVLGEGMLTRVFDQRHYSLFGQTLQTERPDRTASFLMQGHAVLLCEGTPFALVLPVTFFDLMHTSEDVFVRPAVATLERIVRVFSLLFTLLLPGVYVAVMTFHQEVLPTDFMVSTITMRKMVGLPVLFEVLLTSALFEIVREASLRVQGGMNQSLSIIGGLVLGQALSSANIVSPIVLILVALTGLCSFAIPDFSLQMAAYILRYGFLVLGGLFGLVGLAAGFVVLLCYLSTLQSLGVPFFAPYAPATRTRDDMILRRVRRTSGSADTVNMEHGA